MQAVIAEEVRPRYAVRIEHLRKDVDESGIWHGIQVGADSLVRCADARQQ